MKLDHEITEAADDAAVNHVREKHQLVAFAVYAREGDERRRGLDFEEGRDLDEAAVGDLRPRIRREEEGGPIIADLGHRQDGILLGQTKMKRPHLGKSEAFEHGRHRELRLESPYMRVVEARQFERRRALVGADDEDGTLWRERPGPRKAIEIVGPSTSSAVLVPAWHDTSPPRLPGSRCNSHISSAKCRRPGGGAHTSRTRAPAD